MEDKFTTILKREHLIPISQGISTEEMFKSMITSIINDNDFDYEEINNKERFFVCKKICFKGNHIGYSTEEKRQSWFTYKDHQNRYQSTDLYIVEYKRPFKYGF